MRGCSVYLPLVEVVERRLLVERRIMTLIGHATKDVLHAFLRALRAVLVTGVTVFIVVALATEVIAALLTHTIPPGGLTHLVAAALGVAFGYAAAITVAIEELLRAMIKAIELAVAESEKLAGEAIKEAEVLGRKAEEGLVHGAHGALSEAGVLSHDAGRLTSALSHGGAALAGSVIGGVAHEAQSLEHGVSGVIGGVTHGAQSVEHGVVSHLPGRHDSAQ
jgi:phage-related protein